MYVSKLSIQNFRSFGEEAQTIHFSNEKNVITGRNNAGKSNVMKALGLILGTYNFNENTDIFSLQRSNFNSEDEFREAFDDLIVEVKCTLNIKDYSEWHKFNKEYYYGSQDTEIDDFLTFDPGDPQKKQWVTNKGYGTAPNVFFANVHEITLVFSYSRNNYQAEYNVVFEKNGKYCFLYNIKSFKPFTELITAQVLDSFRNPKILDDVTSYSWYGKMLKHVVGDFSNEITTEIETIKSKSDSHFSDSNNELNKLSSNLAFQETKLAFSVIPNIGNDLYKSTEITADDGHFSNIVQKGTGIQSAIIISLFIYYTVNILTKKNQYSVLCIEEPEVFLHPHGRRAVNDRLDDYSQSDNGQLILTTHSTEFLSTKANKINIVRLSRCKNKGSTVSQVDIDSSENRFIFQNEQSLEFLYADKAILCEGGDKYVLEHIAKTQKSAFGSQLRDNWLDDRNISIIKVDGKGNFVKYAKLLKDLRIEYFVLADLDILTSNNTLIKEALSYESQISLSTVSAYYTENAEISKSKAKKFLQTDSADKEKLISTLALCVNNGEIGDEVKDFLQYLKQTKLAVKLKDLLGELPDEIRTVLRNLLQELKNKNIFILSKGEIEDYDSKNILGSHSITKVIDCIHTLEAKGESICDKNNGFQCDEIIDLLKKVSVQP